MNTTTQHLSSGITLLERQTELTLTDISRSCTVGIEFIGELVQEGILLPQGGDGPQNWRFSGTQLRQVQIAARLQRDLGVNLPGAALALQLLDEIETLRAQIPSNL